MCFHLLQGACDKAVGCTRQAVPGLQTEWGAGGQGQLRVTTLSIMGKQGGLSVPQGDCQRLTAPPLGQL